MRIIENGRDGTGVKPNFERRIHVVDGVKELLHLWIVGMEHIFLTAQANWLMEQENHCVNTGGKIVVAQPLDSLVNGVLTENIMNVRFDSSAS